MWRGKYFKFPSWLYWKGQQTIYWQRITHSTGVARQQRVLHLLSSREDAEMST